MVSTITTTSASQIVVKKALFSVVFLRFVIFCSVCLFVILIESIFKVEPKQIYFKRNSMKSKVWLQKNLKPRLP